MRRNSSVSGQKQYLNVSQKLHNLIMYLRHYMKLTVEVSQTAAQCSNACPRASKPWQQTIDNKKRLHEPGTQFANFTVHLQLSLLTSGKGSTMVLCNMFIVSLRYDAKCFPHTSNVRVNISTASSRSSSAGSRISLLPSLWARQGIR